MSNATSKLQLIIESPINKLRKDLGAAKSHIRQATGQMQDKLEEIKIPKLETNSLKRDMQVSENIVDYGVDDMKGKFTELSVSHNNAIQSMTDNIPGLNGMLSSLANPYTAIAAGIGAIIVGAIKLGQHLFESSKEIEGNQQTIRATFGATGDELDILTAKSMATSSIFQKDFKEIATAGNNLYREFEASGLTATEGLELIQKGLIATNGMMDIDNVREYSAQLRQAGYSAEESIALISGQVSQGIFSDKGVDAIKEFGLRIKEMTPAARDALKGIGLDGSKMIKELNSGAKTQGQIMQEVTGAMEKANVTARQTAIADLFGGPGEDLGERALLNLGKINGSLDEQIGKMGPLGQHEARRLELTEQMIAKQQEYAPTFNEMRMELELLSLEGKIWFYDVINEGINFFKEYKEEFKTGFEMIKGIVGFMFDYWITKWRVIMATVRYFTGEFKVNMERIKAVWNFVIDTIKDGWNLAKLHAQEFGTDVLNMFKRIGDGAMALFSMDWGALGNAISGQGYTNQYTQERKNQQEVILNRAIDHGKFWNSSLKQSTDNTQKYWQNLKTSGTKSTSFNSKSNDVQTIVSSGQQGSKTVNVTVESFIKGDIVSQNQNIQNMDQSQLRRWFSEMLMQSARDAELKLS